MQTLVQTLVPLLTDYIKLSDNSSTILVQASDFVNSGQQAQGLVQPFYCIFITTVCKYYTDFIYEKAQSWKLTHPNTL
jgi:hypothetical protein